MPLLTESRPTSGEGGAPCQTCNWQVISETSAERTERCSRCGQVRKSKKAAVQESQGNRRLLTEG